MFGFDLWFSVMISFTIYALVLFLIKIGICHRFESDIGELRAQDVVQRSRILFGGTVTTLFVYTFSTTTVGTAYYTCASAISTSTACTGRRKRRSNPMRMRKLENIPLHPEEIDTILAPSINDVSSQKQLSEFKSHNRVTVSKNSSSKIWQHTISSNATTTKTPPLPTEEDWERKDAVGMISPRKGVWASRSRLGELTITSYSSTIYTISTTTTDTGTTVSLSIQCTLSSGSSVFPAC